MPEVAASYERSRFNALKYGVHQDGIMSCPGIGRCRSGYCIEGERPSAGSPCWHESEYALRLEAEFRSEWEALTITPDVDDFESLVTEFVNINLQRSRAMKRMNDSWTLRNTAGISAASREFDLANLYLDRLANRQHRLEAKLEAGIIKMRERADRLRPSLEAIELLVRGRQRASLEAAQPHHRVWDEFVDGYPDPGTTPTSQSARSESFLSAWLQ